MLALIDFHLACQFATWFQPFGSQLFLNIVESTHKQQTVLANSTGTKITHVLPEYAVNHASSFHAFFRATKESITAALIGGHSSLIPAMKPPQKKQKPLNDWRRNLPHCSQSALPSILDRVKKEGLPKQPAPKDFRLAREAALDQMSLYGPLLETCSAKTLAGGSLQLTFVNLLSYLAGLFWENRCFASYLQTLHGRRCSTAEQPWQAILYTDEVHPGNQLSSSSKRIWCI